MNKDQLQQEILTKVKPGIKPSDLKKQRGKDSPEKNNIPTYSNYEIPTPPPTPPLKPVKTSLSSPPISIEPEEATIRLPSPDKTQEQTLIKQLPPKAQPPQQYLFTCDICQQNQKSQLHLSRVNGLGIDPHKQNKICATCIRKVDLIQEREEEFF